jgi:chemotaxis signal transduction protein
MRLFRPGRQCRRIDRTDATVVSQAFAPEFINPAPVAATRRPSGDLVSLVRLEIGGVRYVVPLASVAAVIEPTSMEPISDDPTGMWIGRVRSQQGAISVASGTTLLRSGDAAPRPGRIAILRAEFPVGLAVDRVLSSRVVASEEILRFPDVAAVLKSVPVTGAVWDEDNELELLLDVENLLAELDDDLATHTASGRLQRASHLLVMERYGDIDYRRALEVRFDASEERWVIPMAAVRLIADSPRPHPLPRAPKHLAGLVSWQRSPIPVIDPTYRLDIARPVSRPARLVVVGEPISVGGTSESADAAILVSGVAGIHYNLRVESGYAWDVRGDTLNLIRMLDVLT